MKRIVIVAGILTIIAVWYASNHYIVISQAGLTSLQKRGFRVSPTFIDTRRWELPDLVTNGDIVLLLVSEQKIEHLPGGPVVAAIIGVQGEAGLARLGNIVANGITTFRELEQRYDVSGKARESHFQAAAASAAREATDLADPERLKKKTKDALSRFKSRFTRE